MGEFRDANLWLKLAFLMTMMGFTCHLFGFGIGVSAEKDIEGSMIVGFLFFLMAAVLILCLVFMDEVNGSKPVIVCFIVCALIAGLAVVIGYGMWGGDKTIVTFSATVGVCGALMSILAGIFGILELVGVTPVSPK